MIYIYGAGGHGKVIAEILELCDFLPSGFFDADLNKKIHHYPTFQFPGPFDHNADKLIIGIGNNEARKKIAETLKVPYYIAIHPFSFLSKHAVVNEGTVIMAGVSINADTSIGKHSIINTNASIDHDCIIESYAHVAPNATLCGNVRIGEGSLVGTGAVIIPGVQVGSNTTIGAGAIVISDIPDNVVVVGNPARIIKKSAN